MSKWYRRNKLTPEESEALRQSAGAPKPKLKVRKPASQSKAQKYYARLLRAGVSESDARVCVWHAKKVWERKAA